MDDIIFKTELLKGAKGDRGDAGEADSIPVDGVIVYEGETIPDGFEETDAPEAITDIISDIEDMKTATASGESLALAPTSEGKALIHTAYGMSVQDGTPTPSVPVDIVSAKADFRSVGKNLIPYPYYETTKTQNDVTFTDNGDGTVTVVTNVGGATNHSHFYFKQIEDGFCFEKGKTYVLTDKVADGGSSNYKTEVALYNGSTYIGTAFSTVNGSVEFTLPNNDTYDRVSMYITVYKNQVITTPITFKPMLRFADVADSAFESYKKTDITTNITLRAIEVSSTDNYNLVRDNKYYIADTLDYSEDNGFVVTRRVGTHVFDENSSVTLSGINNNHIANFSFLMADNGMTDAIWYNTVLSLFNKSITNRVLYEAKTQANATRNGFFANGLQFFIRLEDAIANDAASMTTFLQSNPITVQYLITPTTENITTEQALALLSLKTYDESTSISSQAEPSFTVAIEYAKERLAAVALIAHNLAKGNDLRIAELEQTL